MIATICLIGNTRVKHPHYISPSEIQKYSSKYLHDCHSTPLNVILYKLEQSCGSRIMKGTMMGIDAAMDENITYIYIHISHMYIYICIYPNDIIVMMIHQKIVMMMMMIPKQNSDDLPKSDESPPAIAG